MADFYTLLGVSRSATGDEIKKAYRKAAFENHPDRNASCEKSAERFKAVSQAYDVLMDGSKRMLYDINLERPQSHATGTSTRTTQAQWDAAQHNWSQTAKERWRQAEEIKANKEEANFHTRQKNHAETDRVRYRKAKASAETAQFTKKAETLGRFWGTRSGMLWQDFAAVGALATIAVGCCVSFPTSLTMENAKADKQTAIDSAAQTNLVPES
eukprot:CAMPEP_0198213880 /NCGR_PEP_ID=MMETSP1445-20131203/35083_1 /TAXON_ID=36898 /ORGANISM="Pyramimonas sp., Strain CCMP2087" /LENGTH=212 /DNA_ID=CAMNT_0043888733 /DNA_START=138 /DNA_END=776 /DNA_ORIENTATION=-